MQILKCVSIDDEPLALQLVNQYIQKFEALQLLKSFTDAIEAAAFLNSNTVDLLFIDINMPDIKGTDLVQNLAHPPMIIFTTAYSNYAVQGFELNALDYLVKPISFDRFSVAVQKAITMQQLKTEAKNKGGHLVVRSEYNLIKIELANIEYIESLEDYLKIYTHGAKPVMTLMTMKALLDKLPAKHFIRIHRSYIVPFAKIKSYLNRKVTLLSGTELPVSNSHADELKMLLK